MLQELRVENLLLIEGAQLRFAPGLNVITGETGAGKSVLAHALDLLLGGRARGGIVRPGTAEAYVEGIFDCTPVLRAAAGERLSVEEPEIVLARRVGADGRTRAYVNGRSATLGELRELASRLICFYGQHEHRRLTISAAQLELLDAVCGDEQRARVRACAEAYAERGRLAKRLEKLRALSRDRDRELELLDHELQEIELAAVDEREHAELLASRERLRRVDSLLAAAGSAVAALSGEQSEGPGAAAQLAGASESLDALARVDVQLDSLAARVRALAIEAQDVAGELRDYHDRLAADAGGERGADTTLAALEERLAVIERLLRKHGGSVSALAEHAAHSRSRREQLAGAEVQLADTSEQLERASAELDQQVRALRSARRRAAPRFARAVSEQLAALGMADAAFEASLHERSAGPTGGDALEFVIAPNPGVPAGPVREIASGGELSRIMLALTAAGLRTTPAGAAGARTPPSPRSDASTAAEAPSSTLAFDELDAGIGGHTARAVGERLREIARERQLLCITHLPQIASLGERHFSIVKDTSASLTRASVIELGEPEVVTELVRMLGADSADGAARRHARELRRAA